MPIREAVILAAGLGTRLRPITEGLPKPALPFLNRPVLHWTLDSLRQAGVKRVLINLHHLPQFVRACAESASSGLDLKFSFEPEILGTAGAFGPLRGLLQEEAFLVVNGDVLHRIPYAPVEAELEAHHEALAALALRPGGGGYTPVALDGQGRITAFGSGGDWMFPGVYAARRILLDRLPGPGPRELVPDLLRPLLPSGAVRGVPLAGEWWDLGTPNTYLGATWEALSAVASGRLPVPCESAMETRDGHPLLRHADAWISRDATLTGPVVAGEGVHVESRCHLGGAVLLPGVRMPKGERWERGIAYRTPSGSAFLHQQSEQVR